MQDKPQPLEFEFDESTSMEDILGGDADGSKRERGAARKRPGELPPVNPLEISDDIDMETLLNDDAIEELQKALKMDPNYFLSRVVMKPPTSVNSGSRST